jgi:glycosyltransferase involved in cell wall biosynthesis
MIIHDLIPIYYPDGCNSKFIGKFTDWIKRSHPDTYFCVSYYTAKDLQRFKPEAQNTPIKRIYLGADERFKPISDSKSTNNIKQKYHILTPKYFLAVSEITTRKNLTHLLKAFVQFLEKTEAEDISLVLVGPVRKGYTDIAANIANLAKHQDKIVQTGYVEDNDLPLLYNGSLAFIYPSLYEGFGLPILEAMQCGTPVISSDNTSLPEVGGDAVIYISGKDEKKTAEELQKIYNNPQVASKLSKKGLKQAAKFNWQTTADTVAETIKNMVIKWKK